MIFSVMIIFHGHLRRPPLSGYIKDNALQLYDAAKALDALWRSWKDALGSKRDYAFLRKSTDLPSYYCREINWKIKKGADAPVGVPKDALKLRPGGVFAPWFYRFACPGATAGSSPSAMYVTASSSDAGRSTISTSSFPRIFLFPSSPFTHRSSPWT